VANRDQSGLISGVFLIVECCGQWIIEHGDRLVERHVVLPQIPFGLRPMPFEPHALDCRPTGTGRLTRCRSGAAFFRPSPCSGLFGLGHVQSASDHFTLQIRFHLRMPRSPIRTRAKPAGNVTAQRTLAGIWDQIKATGRMMKIAQYVARQARSLIDDLAAAPFTPDSLASSDRPNAGPSRARISYASRAWPLFGLHFIRPVSKRRLTNCS